MKKYLWLLIVVFVGLVGLGLFYFFKPVSSLQKTNAAYSLDASALFDFYDENETKADSIYLDQVLEVSGTISSVDNQKIQLQTNSMFGIVCEMEPDTDNSRLKIGDQIVCRGMCTGKLMDVVLTRCIIIKQKDEE